MNKEKEFEFKGDSIEDATEKGLKELGLTKDEATVVVVSHGGIFSKPKVKIIPLEKEEVTEEPALNLISEISEEQEEILEEASDKNIETNPEIIEKASTQAFNFVKDLIAKMGVNCEVNMEISGSDININIDGADTGNVIGYRGDVLDAIQYYTLLVCNKKESSFIRIQVDAGKYRQKRRETLTALANRLARKVAKTGKKMALEPMNPFERRIIHTALANDKFVTTSSEGEDRQRHVVIFPKQRKNNHFDKKNNGERREKRYIDPEENTSEAPVFKAPKVEEKEIEVSYGTNSSFKKNGPRKMRSFGGKPKRF